MMNSNYFIEERLGKAAQERTLACVPVAHRTRYDFFALSSGDFAIFGKYIYSKLQERLPHGAGGSITGVKFTNAQFSYNFGTLSDLVPVGFRVRFDNASLTGAELTGAIRGNGHSDPKHKDARQKIHTN
jgi:uncharacterized protein YjbI with pentapeptide repeats